MGNAASQGLAEAYVDLATTGPPTPKGRCLSVNGELRCLPSDEDLAGFSNRYGLRIEGEAFKVTSIDTSKLVLETVELMSTRERARQERCQEIEQRRLLDPSDLCLDLLRQTDRRVVSRTIRLEVPINTHVRYGATALLYWNQDEVQEVLPSALIFDHKNDEMVALGDACNSTPLPRRMRNFTAVAAVWFGCDGFLATDVGRNLCYLDTNGLLITKVQLRCIGNIEGLTTYVTNGVLNVYVLHSVFVSCFHVEQGAPFLATFSGKPAVVRRVFELNNPGRPHLYAGAFGVLVTNDNVPQNQPVWFDYSLHRNAPPNFLAAKQLEHVELVHQTEQGMLLLVFKNAPCWSDLHGATQHDPGWLQRFYAVDPMTGVFFLLAGSDIEIRGVASADEKMFAWTKSTVYCFDYPVVTSSTPTQLKTDTDGRDLTDICGCAVLNTRPYVLTANGVRAVAVPK